MNNSHFSIPKPENEPFNSYAPGTPERAALKKELDKQRSNPIVIPLIIGGKEVYTEKRVKVTAPHDHSLVLAECCMAGEKELKDAVNAAMAAKAEWEKMPWIHRAAIFNMTATLISGKYRYVVAASTMLGQSKTAFQAEIDAPGELCDFYRFNNYNADQIYSEQPNCTPNVWNRQVFRPLEGFVLAITPFNFTSIAGNLPSAPAVMGNTCVWKPATTAVLSNYYIMKIMMEAGLPAGVINFVPSRGSDVSKYVISDSRLAGFHFTGSTDTFASIWAQIGNNISNYRSYPRLVGETGGKDFLFAHPSVTENMMDAMISAIVRASFEYQGQKCSALSRCYIPENIWPTVKEKLLNEIAKIKVGDICDFRNFMGAVIDEKAFKSITEYIDNAKKAPGVDVITGGYDGSKGYFVYPTVIVTEDPDYVTMREEIFGPVVTIYVYKLSEYDKIVDHCANSNPYALTGAIWAEDRAVICDLEEKLRHAAGNFYINDKPSGAIVGQQPFGGSRGSGTNDKAGSTLNLYRWTSVETIKENFAPARVVEYPFMKEE